MRSTGRRLARLALFLLLVLPAVPGMAEGQTGSRHRRTSRQDTSRAGAYGVIWSRGGVTLEPFYTGEVISNLRGGLRQGTHLHGVADLILTADPVPLVGWEGLRFGTAVVGIHGDDPGGLVGDYQGVSSIAAPSTLRLYELWLQQRLLDDRLSLLAGIYDVNAAFDVLETAALFMNSSYGMGPGFACGGPGGVPTYPCPGLSLLVRASLSERIELLGVVADGVPGDPEDPEGISYHVSSEEGFLLGSELSWVRGSEVLTRMPPIAPRVRAHRRRFGIHRFGRGLGRGIGREHGDRGRGQGRSEPGAAAAAAAPLQTGVGKAYYAKFAFGLWRSTSQFSIPSAGGGDPLVREGSWGAYVLAERTLGVSMADPRRVHSFHLRVGVADEGTEEIDRYATLGIVSSRPMGGTGTHQLGLAVTAAHLSRPYADLLGAGSGWQRWEVAFEAAWRVEVAGGLALQPDLQYVMHPGFDPALEDALVVGFRLELSHGG